MWNITIYLDWQGALGSVRCEYLRGCRISFVSLLELAETYVCKMFGRLLVQFRIPFAYVKGTHLVGM